MIRTFCKTLIARVFYDPEKAGWEQEYNFEPEVDGLVTVMNKTNGTDFHQVISVSFSVVVVVVIFVVGGVISHFLTSFLFDRFVCRQ